MISIGCILKGPELSSTLIAHRLMTAMRWVDHYRGEYPEGAVPEVNIVFYVPGSLGDFPNMTEITAGRFSRKKKLLLVGVPVPRGMADSGGSVEFIIDTLRKATALAAEVFARKGAEPFDLNKANEIVEQVRQAMTQSAP
jgi:hypothetical protein